jgi:hypothetical protein
MFPAYVLLCAKHFTGSADCDRSAAITFDRFQHFHPDTDISASYSLVLSTLISLPD